MRHELTRGSGSVTTIAVIGVVVAVTCGLFAGVAVIAAATNALRLAESRALAVATLVAEGEQLPCLRDQTLVVECSTSGMFATVSVDLRGVRASATAGPD
ncbi:MAG: hypothetical protein ACKOWN_07360 [Microbacteriaceae bacterium]